MDDQGRGAAPPGHAAAPEKRFRGFILAGDAPLPDGVGEGDEGVLALRPVAPTREDVEAAKNVAY